ncbi:MAG: response regulator transcription factor [Steroidobacteraceae bacterium]|nr:response regulator transcription factor [Steroidobacteraceae bacterium]
MSPVVSVYLVDDDRDFLNALERVVRAAGLEPQAFTSADELLQLVSPQTRGCVVTDLSMPGTNGLQLQTALAERGAILPIIFLTGYGSIPGSVQAMRAGAVDFLEKTAPYEELLAAIRRALASEDAAYNARCRLDELQRRFATLTPREREVLEQVVSGRMNKQIAASLGISERTVKLHRTAITTKVGVHSSAQLALLTLEARVFQVTRD